ncbi:hypothetical protein PGT21_022101 [Puccinia graminis f. sp. tritici]|uniref:Uncharacterized protein n=1 Tax=Puccinia graminis f. sp. tritici TaxID=56615 RepID=A0A5B0NBH5_PUCGR|nr:hypothetical protein PGT21_022101 [Puccinia graminis f. sp. tritici]KAA1090392.1 hypothetical protein PGTUg99_007010 [Puccinia graminis f. sp. tritici]
MSSSSDPSFSAPGSSDPGPHMMNPRLNLDSSVYVVPALTLLSCIAIMQYGNFCLTPASERSRQSFYLATIGISIHLVQIALDFWYMCYSFQSYLTGQTKDPVIFLYTTLEVCTAVGIAVTVQYHYFRLVQAMPALSKWWTVAIGFFAVATCVGGLGTGAEFQVMGRTPPPTAGPPVISIVFLAFYNMWLISNCLTDGTISIAMILALRHSRSPIRHQSLATTLRRLLFLTVSTFGLTFIVALLSLIVPALPHMIPSMSIRGQEICRVGSFVLNGILPRIYLNSFFCSLQCARGTKSAKHDTKTITDSEPDYEKV